MTKQIEVVHKICLLELLTFLFSPVKFNDNLKIFFLESFLLVEMPFVFLVVDCLWADK